MALLVTAWLAAWVTEGPVPVRPAVTVTRHPPPSAVVSADSDAATRVRVSHILLSSEELANECKRQLAAGADFAELAMTVSTCDSKARGGDLGWISPGLMVPEFDMLAFTASEGVVCSLQSDFGWHVLRVSERSFVEPEMSPVELRQRIDRGDLEGDAPSLQLLDIRGEEELQKAPLLHPASRHLPYEKWQAWAEQAFEGQLGLSRDVELVFMDHRGGRGERLMQYFAQSGFPRARFVRGGVNAYAEEADPSVGVYLESDGDCLTCKEH